MTDEQMARRLQQAFDSEAAQYVRDNPQDTHMQQQLAQQHRMTSTAGRQNAQQPQAGPLESSAAQYPSISHAQPGSGGPATPGESAL